MNRFRWCPAHAWQPCPCDCFACTGTPRAYHCSPRRTYKMEKLRGRLHALTAHMNEQSWPK